MTENTELKYGDLAYHTLEAGLLEKDGHSFTHIIVLTVAHVEDNNDWSAYRIAVYGEIFKASPNILTNKCAAEGDKIGKEEAMRMFANHPISQLTWRP